MGEAYGKWNQKKEFTPTVVDKSDDAKGRIRTVLTRSFLFQSLDAASLEIVVNAMEEFRCSPGDRVIDQGADGDSLFLIEQGTFHCKIKKADGEEITVKTCEAGDAFGELALLYNCPRAASVDCSDTNGSDTALLWKLDRETFNAIVKDAACRKRERYEAFLKSVSILKDLDSYEISQISDALQTCNYPAGQNVINQGDQGDTFYIVEEGALYAWKDSPQTSLMEYGPGQFFGELALLRNDTRAASVTARQESKLLSIDRKTFARLLGPLQNLLESHAKSNY